jgi:hypothetical protein
MFSPNRIDVLADGKGSLHGLLEPLVADDIVRLQRLFNPVKR